MRNILKSKRGSEMTIGTIIIIILALVVLAFIIFGFSMGWANLWDRIKTLGAGGSNVDTIRQACQIACATNSRYDYCSATRSVNLGNGTAATSGTCATLNGAPVGVALCPAITC